MSCLYQRAREAGAALYLCPLYHLANINVYSIARCSIAGRRTTVVPCGPYSTECYPGLERGISTLIGVAVGGVVGALTGALIGSRGVERTYVFEEIAPMPSPEAAPVPVP